MSSSKLEKTENFISKWQEKECLWKVDSTLYRNRDQKMKAVKELAGLFEITENEVKEKINNLRTYYSKEIAKLKGSKKSGAGRGETFNSKWHHFKSMEFIKDTIKRRKTASSLDISEDEDIDVDVWNEEIDTQFNTRRTKDELKREEAENAEPVEKLSTKRPAIQKRKSETSKTKKDYVLDEAMSMIHEVKSRKTLDEDDVYGQNIAFSMRNIKDARNKAYAKLKIQEIIFQAQFGQMETPMNFLMSAGMSPPYVTTVCHPRDNSPPYEKAP